MLFTCLFHLALIRQVLVKPGEDVRMYTELELHSGLLRDTGSYSGLIYIK